MPDPGPDLTSSPASDSSPEPSPAPASAPSPATTPSPAPTPSPTSDPSPTPTREAPRIRDSSPSPGGSGPDTPGAAAKPLIRGGRVVLAAVREQPIEVAECAAAVADPAHGAIASFAGVVRDHDGGQGVSWLRYEAHPDARAAIEAAAGRIAERFPSTRLAVLHRVGLLAIGDTALAAAAGSAHRAEAFAAIAALVDEVKAGVPIWKEQGLAAGGAEWVGAG